LQYHTKEPHQNHALADKFAEQTREAERTFIASLWLNPVAGHDAAVDAKLEGDDFFDPHHSWVFCYVCLCAESGLSPDVAESCRFAKRDGIHIFAPELFAMILDTRTDHRLPDLYATTVRLYARKRRLASKHLRKIGNILKDGLDDGATIPNQYREQSQRFSGRTVA
jgi:hypothetical protein